MSKQEPRSMPPFAADVPPPVRWWRTFWAYRHLIATACILGVTLWFITANQQPVSVTFPFGLGQMNTSVGLAFLFGMLFGVVVTLLIVTVVWTLRKGKAGAASASARPTVPEPDPSPATVWPDDRPPSDYAARTGEGISGTNWPAR